MGDRKLAERIFMIEDLFDDSMKYFQIKKQTVSFAQDQHLIL